MLQLFFAVSLKTIIKIDKRFHFLLISIRISKRSIYRIKRESKNEPAAKSVKKPMKITEETNATIRRKAHTSNIEEDLCCPKRSEYLPNISETLLCRILHETVVYLRTVKNLQKKINCLEETWINEFYTVSKVNREHLKNRIRFF